MNFASKFFANRTQTFPYIQINGSVTRETTIFVEAMLHRMPSSTKKLGIVINSNSGSLAQAHIINYKINVLSKRRGIQLYTFIQDCAVNAGFLLASNGHKIYADNTSIIGGLQVSVRKIVLGDMIRRITYSTQPSLGSQLNHTQQMDPSKKQQIERVFTVFSHQMEGQIRKTRNTPNNIDLKSIFSAKQAKQYGLIDAIGRINRVIPQQFSQYQLLRLQESAFDRIRNDLRKLNVW